MGPDILPVTLSRFQLAQARLSIASGRAQDAIGLLRQLVAAPVPEGVQIPLDRVAHRSCSRRPYLQQNQINEALEMRVLRSINCKRSAMRDYYPVARSRRSAAAGSGSVARRRVRAARLNLERSLSLRIANDHPSSPWIAESQIALAECLIAHWVTKHRPERW